MSLKYEPSSEPFHNSARKLFFTRNPLLGSLPPPPLFDVIYRIPEASMRLARDDRQAALWYKSERKKMVPSLPLHF